MLTKTESIEDLIQFSMQNNAALPNLVNVALPLCTAIGSSTKIKTIFSLSTISFVNRGTRHLLLFLFLMNYLLFLKNFLKICLTRPCPEFFLKNFKCLPRPARALNNAVHTIINMLNPLPTCF